MELENIILRMDELKEELDNLRPLREDHLSRLNQKLKLDWNYHSNSIEGNTLSLSETKSFILWGITAKGKPFRDYLEMKGHNDALNQLYKIVNKDLRITEKLIQDFHRLILVKPYADNIAEINPGEWKENPNYLYSSTGERIDFAPPEDVPKLMNALINWLNNHLDIPKRKKKKYDLHPLLIAAGFHTQFIKIHPFGDGNGRMARIMTNLVLMLCGYVPAIIKLDNRTDYYTAINNSSLDKPENLAKVLGLATIESLEIAIKAAKGLAIEEEEDMDKELKLLQLKLKQKQVDIPIKSKDRIREILHKDAFPFFDKLIVELKSFDSFFETISIDLFFNGAYNTNNVFNEKYYQDRKKEILQSFDIKFRNTGIVYFFKNMKSMLSPFSISLKLEIEFRKYEYIIKDDITRQKLLVKYNQSFPEPQQNEWVKKIKAVLLQKIKTAIDT